MGLHGASNRSGVNRGGTGARWLAMTVAMAMAASPTVAVAAPKSPVASADVKKAETLASSARQAFKDKQFDAAAKQFMQAYGVSHEPALVFNAARAYEEGGKSGDAAALFRLYMTISQDVDGIADARLRITKLEAKASAAKPSGAAAAVDGSEAATVTMTPVPAQPSQPRPDAVAQPAGLPVVAKPPTATPSTAKPDAAVAVQSANAMAPEQSPRQQGSLPPARIAAGGPPREGTVAMTEVGMVAGVAVGVVGGVLVGLAVRKANAANILSLSTGDERVAYDTEMNAAQAMWRAGVSVAALGVLTAGVSAWLYFREQSRVTFGVDAAGNLLVAGRW